MRRLRMPAMALLGVALLSHMPVAGQEFKGQITLPRHEVKLESGKLYEVILESPKDFPLNVTALNLQVINVFGQDFQSRKMYCMPSQETEAQFFISPAGFFGGQKTTCDYVLKVKSHALAKQPMLQVDDKWTDQDPIYPAHKTHFRDYKVNLAAGKLYVIDLVKGGQGLDPYLFLEGANGKVVAQDDDSGGDLNARIIYSPTQDGVFRIIATTLVPATGNYTLTVRQTE
jgi:hypothetical protein